MKFFGELLGSVLEAITSPQTFLTGQKRKTRPEEDDTDYHRTKKYPGNTSIAQTLEFDPHNSNNNNNAGGGSSPPLPPPSYSWKRMDHPSTIQAKKATTRQQNKQPSDKLPSNRNQFRPTSLTRPKLSSYQHYAKAARLVTAQRPTTYWMSDILQDSDLKGTDTEHYIEMKSKNKKYPGVSKDKGEAIVDLTADDDDDANNNEEDENEKFDRATRNITHRMFSKASFQAATESQQPSSTTTSSSFIINPELYEIFGRSLRLQQTEESFLKTQQEAAQVAITSKKHLDLLGAKSRIISSYTSNQLRDGHWLGERLKQAEKELGERHRERLDLAVLDKTKNNKKKEEEEDQLIKKKFGTSEASLPRLPKLKQGWRDTYDEVTSNSVGNATELLVEDPVSKNELKRKDMRMLANGEWVNDCIVNTFMSLIVQRDAERRKKEGEGGEKGVSEIANGRTSSSSPSSLLPRCHCLNTFFYAKLNCGPKGYCYKDVRKWTLPIRLKNAGQISQCILDVDRIIIPINLNNTHWTCAMIDIQHKKFQYFDSMMCKNEACLEALAQWLKDEYKDKRGEERGDVLEWAREFPVVPRQNNCSDCGVFTMLFAEHSSRGAEFGFKQQHMPEYRVQICNELLELNLS